MNLLVTYDVNTITSSGRRRLRMVARICESYGQRVQYSVFEVTCSRTVYARMLKELTAVVVEGEDSLRIYCIEQRTLDDVIAIGLEHALQKDQPWSL